MTGYPHRLSPRRAGLAAIALALVALPAAGARAQGLLSLFGGGPGPSSYEIERRLEASGYIVTGPLMLRGDVFLADVIVRGEGPERLIIDPESGRIMQRFRMHGGDWREAAAPPPGAWSDDPREWNGPRPPADVGPGVPPPTEEWLPASPSGPAVVETPRNQPRTAPRKAETKPKYAPMANVANPPAGAKPAAAPVKPTPAASSPPLAQPSPAASAAPSAPATPAQQAAKADAPPVAAKPPASAPSQPAPTKTKSVNDIPVTPLD